MPKSLDFVSSLRLTKEQKQAKTAIPRQKSSEKSLEGIKKWTFHQKLLYVLLLL